MAPAANGGVAVAPPGGAKPTTVDQARRVWAAEFRAAGLDSPELDARILVGHALSLDHAGLAAASARQLAAGEASAIAPWRGAGSLTSRSPASSAARNFGV